VPAAPGVRAHPHVAREAQDISRGYQYGAVDYLTKPLDPDPLRAKVSVLRMRRAIATIQRNAEAQKRLVDDLIDISTMTSPPC
jgi:DNA-binding response OmpR family regulator